MAGENASAQERTEEATPRRKEEARREGRVARSSELSAAAVLLGGTALLAASGAGSLATFSTRTLRECARALSGGALGAEGAVALLRTLTLGLVIALAPFALGILAITIFINVVQTGGLITAQPLMPKLSNLDPLAGLKRIASADAVFTLIKSIVKLVALGAVAWMVLSGSWGELTSLGGAEPAAIGAVMRSTLTRLSMTAGLAFLCVALIDYLFQRAKLNKSLRMSRSEIVREYRESEGDPMIKGRIQAIARARARKRMLGQVATADVVVVNPTHIAIALRYDVSIAPAPVVVAMGERKLAERIKAIALKAGVPIVENRPVARALIASAKVGQTVPPALYAAVAEILAWVYRRRAGLPGLPAPRITGGDA